MRPFRKLSIKNYDLFCSDTTGIVDIISAASSSKENPHIKRTSNNNADDNVAKSWSGAHSAPNHFPDHLPMASSAPGSQIELPSLSSQEFSPRSPQSHDPFLSPFPLISPTLSSHPTLTPSLLNLEGISFDNTWNALTPPTSNHMNLNHSESAAWNDEFLSGMGGMEGMDGNVEGMRNLNLSPPSNDSIFNGTSLGSPFTRSVNRPPDILNGVLRDSSFVNPPGGLWELSPEDDPVLPFPISEETIGRGRKLSFGPARSRSSSTESGDSLSSHYEDLSTAFRNDSHPSSPHHQNSLSSSPHPSDPHHPNNYSMRARMAQYPINRSYSTQQQQPFSGPSGLYSEVPPPSEVLPYPHSIPLRNNFAEMATFEKSRSLSTGATPRGDREAGKTGKSMPSSPNHHFRYRHKAKTARHRQRSINSRKDEDLSKYELNPRRVAAGQDTRATLMIKNIPNKYDQEMLLEAINKRFRGSYDFFYLPIDFKNKCNVGYAFINFIAYETVAPFFEEFNQKKWEKFNSEKVCKITYARIQGKNAFIDHFRNSSLMYEDLTCRPLIFHSSGPAIGELEQFPPANVLRRPNAPEDFQE